VVVVGGRGRGRRTVDVVAGRGRWSWTGRFVVEGLWSWTEVAVGSRGRSRRSEVVVGGRGRGRRTVDGGLWSEVRVKLDGGRRVQRGAGSSVAKGPVQSGVQCSR